MTRENKTRKYSLHTQRSSGHYGFDNGAVAFSDITERLEKKATKVEHKREYNRDYQRGKKKVEASSKTDYHRKHG